jgi:hypothetical protein
LTTCTPCLPFQTSFTIAIVAASCSLLASLDRTLLLQVPVQTRHDCERRECTSYQAHAFFCFPLKRGICCGFNGLHQDVVSFCAAARFSLPPQSRRRAQRAWRGNEASAPPGKLRPASILNYSRGTVYRLLNLKCWLKAAYSFAMKFFSGCDAVGCTAAHPRSATINHAPTCRRAAGAMARVQNRFASRDPKDQEDAENHPKGHQ